MIRAYDGGCKGATAFFRNRPFLDQFFKLLSARCGQKCKVLVHACSIGAEPYSLAFWSLHRRKEYGVDLTIHATDVNAAFLGLAQQGVYPSGILDGMTPEERSWFEIGNDVVLVPERIRQMVKFLPPRSFVDSDLGETYDAVLIMNALTYVSQEQQRAAICHAAARTRHVLALTAFHPDTIRRDVEQVGFLPHPEGMEEIHAAWGDRLSNYPIDPLSPEYSWKLPPFDCKAPDSEYRLCSLFARRP